MDIHTISDDVGFTGVCHWMDLRDLGTISISGSTIRLHCDSQYGILSPIRIR